MSSGTCGWGRDTQDINALESLECPAFRSIGLYRRDNHHRPVAEGFEMVRQIAQLNRCGSTQRWIIRRDQGNLQATTLVGGFEGTGIECSFGAVRQGDTAKIKNLRQAERYLPDNIYDALANFRESKWTSKLLGEDVKGRYADLKQAAADRCPRSLGTFVKAPEVQYHHEVYNQFLWNLF